MKSKVFSVDLYNAPEYQSIGIYRTNGMPNGGKLRTYLATSPRLIRLLRAMVNASTRVPCCTYEGQRTSIWTINGVVSQMREARSALDAS